MDTDDAIVECVAWFQGPVLLDFLCDSSRVFTDGVRDMSLGRSAFDTFLNHFAFRERQMRPVMKQFTCHILTAFLNGHALLRDIMQQMKAVEKIQPVVHAGLSSGMLPVNRNLLLQLTPIAFPFLPIASPPPICYTVPRTEQALTGFPAPPAAAYPRRFPR